jgi:SAM-dependent methyltransferase
MTKTLDLGCGPNPKNPFGADEIYGVDIINFNNPNIGIADLAIDKIPFEDNSFDYITGFDFLEHIPRILYMDGKRRQPFIDIMSEVHRVLKSGGRTMFATPGYPHPETFQDPQHVNFITEQTVNYFCIPSEKNGWDQSIMLGQAYGFIGAFELIGQYWRQDVPYHLVWELAAIK